MAAIKDFRKILNITQEELAKKMEVNQSTIASWESGRRKPDIYSVKKLSEIFGCSTDDLLCGIIEEKEKDEKASI